MSKEKIAIRLATSEDAAEIANIHLNSWREAYRELLPQEFLDRLPLTFRRRFRMWNSTLGKSDVKERVFVAESDQVGVIGFSAAVPGRDEKFKNFGEISAIYLLEAYKKRGLGFQLLNSSFQYLFSAGFKRAYCWVLENNPTSAFYERTGGSLLTDEIKFAEIGGKQVREFAYSWDLNALFASPTTTSYST